MPLSNGVNHCICRSSNARNSLSIGTKTVWENLPAIVVRQRPHSCPDHFSGRKNNLQSGMEGPMITIRCVSHSSVKGVSQYRTTSKVRDIDPQVLVAPGLDLLIECIESHPRLHQAGTIVRVDVEDLVHAPPKIDDDGSANAGCCPTIANYTELALDKASQWIR